MKIMSHALTDEELALLRGENAFMPVLPTLEEMMKQPQVLAGVLANLEPKVSELSSILVERRCNRILMMGSGDSYYAAAAARLAFEQFTGVIVEALQAYEYAAYGAASVDDRTAVVVISSSGRPTTTWNALDRALNSQALVIGVTDSPYPGNPFAERPQFVLVPGAEKTGWPTQTTTTTLAVLLQLAILFGGKKGTLAVREAETLLTELYQLPYTAAEVLSQNMTAARSYARLLQPQNCMTIIAGGPNLAVANIGNALLAESSQKTGVVYEVEEFNHSLRAYTLHPGEPVFLIAPSGHSLSRMEETILPLQQRQALIVAVVDEDNNQVAKSAAHKLIIPKTHEAFSPLLALLPLHLLSVFLAVECLKTGYHRPETSI